MNAVVRVPIHPNPAMYASPEMVQDIAIGKDPTYEIAARYGLSQGELDWLLTEEWFARSVAQRRLELHENGMLFSAKARMMAEEMFQDLFQLSKADQLAHPLRVDVAKQLSILGDMVPKGGVTAGDGQPRFQLNIQVNGVDQAAARRTRLDVEDVKPVVTMHIPFSGPAVAAAPVQADLTVPDFQIPAPNRDLVGTAEAMQAAVAQPPK